MDKTERLHFGRMVRRERKQRGLTQQQLATAIGLNTHETISKLENGHAVPSMQTLTALSKVFTMPIWRFFVDDRLVPAQGRLRPGEAAVLELLSRLPDDEVETLRQMVEAYVRSRP